METIRSTAHFSSTNRRSFSLYQQAVNPGNTQAEGAGNAAEASAPPPKTPITFLNTQADVFMSSVKFKGAITLSASSTTTLFVIPDQGADDRNRD